MALAIALVLSLTASLLTDVPALAEPRPSQDDQSRKSVRVGKVKPRPATKSATDGRGITAVTRKTLPRAASGTVAVSGKSAKVGDLPVTLSPAAPSKQDDSRPGKAAAPPTSVKVQVKDQAAAKKAGVAGALLTLSRADGVTKSGRARLTVNYWQFANAFGGDYAGRLRLVELPTCALTTPHAPTCRGRDLQARNTEGTLSAEVSLAGAGTQTLIGIMAAAASAGGTFEATSLRQAYSWAAGNASGNFTYNYPIQVPPAPGPAPSLALTYDSGLVDGQTIAQNGQASWVGEGWDLQVGYIERSYRPCSQDGLAADHPGLCWFSSDNATLVFGGQASPLVRDATNGWRSAKDDGLKIEKLNDTKSGSLDNDGEYWRITGQDGTQYYFGKHKRYDRDNQVTNSVQTVPVLGNNTGEPCTTFCDQAYRWNLDYVVDRRGNTMTYVYSRYTGSYLFAGKSYMYDLAANLDHIDYGTRFEQEHSAKAPMRVRFITENRCIGSCTPEDYRDTPMDLYCAVGATECANDNASFFNNKRLSKIVTEVVEPTDAQYRPVDEWTLTQTYPLNPDEMLPEGPDTSENLWLDRISHRGYSRDGTWLDDPPMDFGGTEFRNRVDWNAEEPVKVPGYFHYRLTSVNTGTGAETIVNYDNTPDVGVPCDRTWKQLPNTQWAPIPDNNPYLCFPQYHKPHDSTNAGFGWFYKYLVKTVQEHDLTGGSPGEVTFYKYTNDASSDAALWGHDTNESVELKYRTWSQWRGFSTVTASKEATETVETVSRNIYHRGMDGDGKTKADGSGIEWYSRRTGLLTPVGTPGLDGAIVGQGGKCLDIQGPNTANGSVIHLWGCYDTWSQAWQRQPNGSLKNPQSGKCLDIKGPSTANGTTIHLWDCFNTWSQIWQPRPDGSLRNPQSNKCLDLTNWGTADGTKFQLWDCTTNWHQVFQPQADGSLKNPQANRCIDIANSATTDGTKIQSRACVAGAVNQTWQLQANGSLKNLQSDKCLDISGPNTASGTLVHLWTCYPGWSQIWQPQADGSLKNPESGKCLEAGSGTDGSANGQLMIWDCTGGLTQQWLNRFTDSDGLHGFLRESQELDGTRIQSSTIHVPTVTQTATRAAPATGGQEMRAHRVRETTTKARTWIAADSKWRWTEAQATYDTQYGLPIDTRDLGDTAVADDDTCTRTEYARNPGAHMVSFPSQVTERAGSCDTGAILSRSQIFYDNTTTLHAAPTKGLTTKSQSLTATGPDVWAVTEAAYDDLGRPTSNKDARGQTSTTAYNPPGNLPLKEVEVGNPLAHKATTKLDLGRGLPTELIDANGKITQIEYDPLGRRTAVYLPTEKKVNGDPPSRKYSYQINSTGANRITTEVLQTKGTSPVYLASYEFLDGRFRTRNTQTTAPGSPGGRIVTETKYDSRGQVAAQTAPFYNAAIAGSALVTAAAADVPSQTVFGYDNLGRVKTETLQANGVEKWHTTHTYDGDRHTVDVPSGGNPTDKFDSTSIFDALGRTVQLTVHPRDGASETTSYSYDTAGNLAKITDAAGNETRYGYNLAGMRTIVEDPDTGTTTSTYNAIGDLTSTLDARGQKISYEYDVLGRSTFRWSGEPGTGTKLASYEYDKLNAALGQLSKTTRHVGTADYVVEPMGYDDRYRPTGTRWIIPAAEGAALSGTYQTEYGYDSADHLNTITYPQRAGLPAETVTVGYDGIGYPTTLTGVTNYVTAAGYTGIGQLASRTYGDPGAGQLIRNYGWESATGRLSRISATLPDAADPGSRKTVQDDRYSYLPTGDISSIKDHTDGQSQCYRYDGLHRLTEAYTSLDDCATDPTNVSATGKHPYWDSFAFDNAGRRTADTHRTANDIISRTYNYPDAGQPRQHAMSSVLVTTNGVNRTDTYGYDLAGNMRTRTVANVKSDYTINPEGRFEGATVGQQQTKHLYDADNALLIRTDPAGKTLYLGAEELKATGNTVTGTRYYSHNGAVVAVRNSEGVAWLAADHQATANLTVDPTTGSVQRRWYTPYGADRAQVTDWPTDRGFLNAPANTSTKLLDVGAREYDPDTGTFIAPDPLLDLGNPNSFNPYAYAYHNPITLSDPTGLSPGDNSPPMSPDEVRAERMVAATLVAGTAFIAVVVCAGSAGIGCAIMAGAAIVGGISAATAEDGERVGATFKGMAGGAAGGAAGGVLLASTAGIAGMTGARIFAAGYAAGVAENATGQYLDTGNVDWRQSMLAGALGGALGLAGMVAGKLAGKLVSKIRGCTRHSFAPVTPVLMADGSTKAIKDIAVGDQVTATDPETGQTEAKPVEQLHSNHDSDLTDLTVRVEDTTPTDGTDDSRVTVLHTTQHHPFWDQTSQEWVDAAELTVGHELRTADGDTVTVTAVRNHTGGQNMRDLTVADIHTYYVVAGGTPVLVHNCNKNQGVYIFDDVSKPGHVYVGQTNNFTRRFGEHMGKGRLNDPKDAICIHVCGSADDLKVMEYIIKDQLQEYGFRLSSPIEPNTRNVYNSLRRFVQKPLFRLPEGGS